MRSIFFLAVGVAAGALVAHRLQQTEKGKQFFDGVDARTKEFTDAIKDGYQARDRELRGDA